MKSLLNITSFRRTNRQAAFSIIWQISFKFSRWLNICHCYIYLWDFVLLHCSNGLGLLLQTWRENMPAVGHKYWCGSLTQSEGASKKMFRGLLWGRIFCFCFCCCCHCFAWFLLWFELYLTALRAYSLLFLHYLDTTALLPGSFGSSLEVGWRSEAGSCIKPHQSDISGAVPHTPQYI